MKADFRRKVRNFISKYKNIIMLVGITWLILIAVNIILSNQKPSDIPVTGYDPFEPIILTGEETPKNMTDLIEDIIERYIGYCNNKEYQKAYEMISKDCRDYVYPNIADFKSYVDYVFKTEKVYSIQNYVNYDNVYIYRIRIFEDILASGMTGMDSFKYFEEKLTFTKENDKILFSVKDFIRKQYLNDTYEDNYIKITANSKIVKYDEQIYNLTVENKTNNYMVIYKKDSKVGISIETAREQTEVTDEGLMQDVIAIAPKGKRDIKLSFDLFFDYGVQNEVINFNNILFLKEYNDAIEIQDEDILAAHNAKIQIN